MKSAFRSPVLRFLVLFVALLGLALGLASMSPAPDAPDAPASHTAPAPR